MKFECKQCGKCCGQFDSNSGGIMIFEWERAALEKVAKEKNCDFKIEAGQVDYDAKSNTRIITTFAFKAKFCPYLKDKRCSIHPERPSYCKAYPLLVEMHEKKFNLKLLSCPNAEIPKLENPEKLDWTNEDHYLTNYYRCYGDIFLQALELEIFRHNYLEIMEGLQENGLVELRNEKPTDRPETMTFFEFLVKKKFITQKAADKIINEIVSLSNAKAMVGLK